MERDWKALDLLKFPVLILKRDLTVEFANEAAKKAAVKPQSCRCYEFNFGFSVPCFEIPGYSCPLKETFEKELPSAATVGKYPTAEGYKKLLLEVFKVDEETAAEVILDYEKIEELGEDNPYYVSKSKLLKLIQRLLDENRVFFVSVVNVKKLRSINQLFGISVGDRVIEAIERVLKSLAFKYGFYYSQVAGGYFVVVVSDNERDPYAIEKELFDYLERLQELYNLPVRPRISIVTGKFSSLITKDADEVFKILFYAEKFLAGDGVLYLNAELIDQILSSLGLKKRVLNEIERILKERAVDVHFQPIVDLKTGKVAHLEALIRVKQNGSYLPVGKFIELIYEMNLITDFDLQVLDKLVEYLPYLKRFKKEVFVNTSAVDLKNPEYQKKLVETINRFKEEGLDLSLEITEQFLLDEVEFLEFLHSAHGLRFAIDDFGTGYSSLKLVIDLVSKGVVEAIKLDCSLVRSYFENNEAKAIVNSVVGFTKELGLETIAECVETEEQAKTLKEVGVTHAQGWYFYKPMPVWELEKVLSGEGS
ncbi:MAG: EAL domain-containing protein [Aquificae bacterium]|nr:EAL domain-containing protein [Aquificota bacterium]